MSKYIDFDDPQNRDTYVGRTADQAWGALLEELTRSRGGRVADLGCGGGIYTKAIARLGPELVVGADSSQLSLESARKYCAGLPQVTFLLTDAESIGVADNSFDTIVERALIHHLRSVSRNFREALRVLKPSGNLWVQDRTVADALLPPSQEHIRGFYMVFDKRLRDTEVSRRRHEGEVTNELLEAGFRKVRSQKICELRKVFRTPDELREEIVNRRGRSLLHVLDDQRLGELADFVLSQINSWPVHEKDTWTVWLAEK